ncbi:MAG: hypothetical protein LBE12_16730 [Planctomycetaceae bacterium]|jgi:hypothetical protein|nr:hypothetical protein [Planctomycetaceae bacterium]
MTTIRLSFIIFLSIGMTLACNRVQKPNGLPKLFPCTIVITQNGVPVQGILISLVDPTVTEHWAVSGLTNISGTATIRTHGNFVGAPSGVYKVILSKTEKTGEDDTTSGTLPSQLVPLQIYSLIDTKYNDEATTPLKITVENKKVTETFEIGPAVRILVQTINPNNI